jgi:hypothetical protein
MDRLDRIERKINRIGSTVLVLAVIVLVSMAFAFSRILGVTVSVLQAGALASLAMAVTFALWRPFKN